MNFYAHQDRARNLSRWFGVFFLLNVALTALALTVFLRIFVFTKGSASATVLLTFLGVGGVCFIAGILKKAALGDGGTSVAVLLGGTLVPVNTVDPKLQQLRNVIEEMAIAALCPIPQIYVLENESAINAFAAGLSVQHSVIGVTRGALDRLSRDELQGVIAHEFSHIVNGDVILNFRLVAAIAGIDAISSIGRSLMRVRRRGKRSENSAFIGLGLFAIGGIGHLLARILQAAVSRQREFLADAQGAQYTRQPGGLAAALMKIAGVVPIKNAMAAEFSHAFFGLPGDRFFATHPPVGERVRRLTGQRVGERGSGKPSAIVAPSAFASFAAPTIAQARDTAEARSLLIEICRGKDPSDGGGVLPLVELCLTTLRSESRENRAETYATLVAVAADDQHMNVREFILLALSRRELAASLSGHRRVARNALNSVTRELAHLFSLSLHLGETPAPVARRFLLEHGLRNFGVAFAYLESSACDWQALFGDLDRLESLAFADRQKVVAMLIAIAGIDGRITRDEADLRQAVAVILECPERIDSLRA